MPRALVTGIRGFVGPYLAEHLRSLGHEVIGTCFPGDGAAEAEVAGCRALPLDVRQPEAVMEAVRELRPDVIYHLAGVTRPATGQTREFFEVNLMGSLHVLEAAQKVDAAVLLVSSAYVYGAHDGPLSEEAPLRPVNPYGASKAAADLAAVPYALAGTRVIRARPFNHSGPGQSPDFLLPTLVHQLARIEAGLEPPVLKLGNLEAVRDFCDVRDVVRAYALLMEGGESGEVYNVASGTGVSVRELVELVLGLASRHVTVEVEPARVRATDIPHLVGDASKLKRAVGWRPEYALERTLADMLEHERRRLSA